LDITYKYDGFGRPLSKTSVDVTNIGASREVRTTEESYQYHLGTVILRSIKGGRQFNFDYDNTNTINSRSYIESSRINVSISDTRHEIVAVYRYDLAGR